MNKLQEQFVMETGRSVFVPAKNLCFVQSAEYVEWLENKLSEQSEKEVYEKINEKLHEAYNKAREEREK